MSIPEHVAIIMDGNGRWAKQRMMPRYFGHRKGLHKLIDVFKSAITTAVQCLKQLDQLINLVPQPHNRKPD
jgi:undecaprenyl diphosphate synthase